MNVDGPIETARCYDDITVVQGRAIRYMATLQETNWFGERLQEVFYSSLLCLLRINLENKVK